MGSETEYDLDDVEQRVRSETIRELEAKYKDICTKKIAAAVEYMEYQIQQFEKLYADLHKRNQKLEIIKAATDYCHRHGHIDEAAVLYTGLDKALLNLERYP